VRARNFGPQRDPDREPLHTYPLRRRPTRTADAGRSNMRDASTREAGAANQDPGDAGLGKASVPLAPKTKWRRA
jgi:hypothetical protein